MQQGKMQAFPVTQALLCFSLMNKMMMNFRVGKKEGVQPKASLYTLATAKKNTFSTETKSHAEKHYINQSQSMHQSPQHWFLF
jgi:hypothetical protein